MRVLFDTSVLVAALVTAHPAHERSFPWLRRALSKELDYLVAAHSLLELYAVLSRLPLAPRISPATARRLVEENVAGAARVVTLSASDYRSVLTKVADLGLAGGGVYDALVARAAQKGGADRLLTLNLGHFERLWPELRPILPVP